METCKECRKGFCPSRARRFFGRLPAGICSPTCAKKISPRDEKVTKALAIADELFVDGFISETDLDQVAEIILEML